MDKRRVIIYGAGETGIALKRTLDHDPKVNMSVVAFLDDDERKSNKGIDGIRICHSEELKSFIVNNEISDLLIAANLSPKRKNEIVDFCLENNIKVLTLPPLPSWVDGHINTSQIQDIKIEDLLEREPIEIQVSLNRK
jgi:FlaA1/EpsC-like NDP-sugar epimerase